MDGSDGPASTAPGRTGKVLAAMLALLLVVGLVVWSFGPTPAGGDAPSAVADPGATTQSESGAVPASADAANPLASPAAVPAPAVANPVAAASATVPVAKSAAAAANAAAAIAATKVKPAAGQKATDAPALTAAPAGTGAAPARAAAEPAPSAPVAAKAAASKAADAAQASGNLVAGNPEKGCEGRILLGFQTCMNTQCEKPEFFSHAVCKQRRMAEQARAAQQNNRN